MNPETIALLLQTLQLVPALVQAGQDVAGIVTNASNVLKENRAPTTQEWMDLNALMLAELTRLKAPAPTAQA